MAHTELDIHGMHCASCISRVETALAGVPGVTSARANLATNQASIEFDPALAVPADLVEAVQSSGYDAALSDTSPTAGASLGERERSEQQTWLRRVVIGTALLVPLAWVTYLAPLNERVVTWAGLLLATPIYVYLGWPYLYGAGRRALHGSANMDTLVVLGTTAAFGAGVWDFVRSFGHVAASNSNAVHADHRMMFVDASLILTIVTLGKYLESKAKGRASSAIRRLLSLAPDVTVCVRDGQQQSVPTAQVREGETILVRPGQLVPLDVRVLSGNSDVNEAWLTGESLPVEKKPDSEIFAGTINGQGALIARVVRTSRGTTLARVAELVRRAQDSKANVQRLADRAAAWFVPVVLVIAAGTLAGWWIAGNNHAGLEATIAVLVVACPCAMGLATPTAVMIGCGRGAEQGILIKNAHALEIAAQVTTVVLDKTGTITRGLPTVVEIIPHQGVSDAELLITAASAEQLSAHPVAGCVVEEARRRGLKLPIARNLQVVPGQGIRARGLTGDIMVGNELLLTSSGVDTAPLAARLATARSLGRTPLLVAVGTRLFGALVVADVVAPHSREAIGQLRALGLRVILLSGDHQRTASAVAREVSIETVIAEVRPDQKQQHVAEFRAAGDVVAMVGDGINDAPALAAADVGIALGAGSDIAIESADVVLIGSDLRGVVRTIRLSRATVRTIYTNLLWAFIYNIVLIPLAVVAILPPVYAAVAMAASSVSVVANSLLLRRKRIE